MHIILSCAPFHVESVKISAVTKRTFQAVIKSTDIRQTIHRNSEESEDDVGPCSDIYLLVSHEDHRTVTYQTGSGWDNEQQRWTSDATAPGKDR